MNDKENIEAICVACGAMDKDILFHSASHADIKWLSSKGYPDDIVAFFEANEPVREIEIEGVMLVPIRDLQDANCIAMPGLVSAPLGFPVVAKTIGGDVYCVAIGELNRSEYSGIYLIPHDQFGEEADLPTVQASAIRLALNFTDFLERFAQGNLPDDINQAKWFI